MKLGAAERFRARIVRKHELVLQGRRVLGELGWALAGEELIARRAEASCEHLWRGGKVALASDVIVGGVGRGEATCRYLLGADRVRLLVRVVTASVEATE